MTTAGEGSLLHSRPFRSVSLERDAAGRGVVVKRFHHPNFLLARFDRGRARSEYRALLALERARLPVPRPLDLRRGPRGWEVRLEPIEDARSLDELLRERAAPGGGWPRLCAALGALLAALHASGFEHGDLHPGNVLLDGQGRPWLIDFHRARRRSRSAGSTRRARDLLAATAAAREALPPRTRARFLLAWLAALPGELRPPGARGELAEGLERDARFLRRSLLREGAGRWLRESSRVRCLAQGGRTHLLRRDLDPCCLEEIERRSPRFLVLEGSARELRARWLAAARLVEHGIPAARPAVLDRGSQGRAAFELPPGARPAVLDPGSAQDATALGTLLGSLHERGLDVEDPLHGGALVRGERGLHLLPPRRLLDLDPLDPRAARWRDLGADPPAGEARRVFLAAYLAAFPRPREQAGIAAALDR